MRGRGRRRGYGLTGFEDAGGYMAAKISKLQNQYKKSISATDGERSHGIFSGIAIFVNGYTDPTGEELKRIMMVHGGTYHHYYSRSATTHIIASNLPDTKIKNLNTDRIVSPKWISDSLQAGHLLDYTKYLLYTKQSRSQPKLCFKKLNEENGKMSENSRKVCNGIGNRASIDSMEEKPKLHPTKEENKSDKLNEGNGNISKDHGSPDSAMDNTEEKPTQKNNINRMNEEKKHDLDTSTSFKDVDITKIQTSSGDCMSENKRKNSASEASIRVPISSPTKGHHMSTANPGFLSEFYNNSRLHHISTMGSTFKEYVNELQRKNEGFPGREKLMNWVKNHSGGKEGQGSSSEVHGNLPPYNAFKNNSGGREGYVNSSPFEMPNNKIKRTIMHIDMDCFFVSVGLRKHPELKGKPVAVTHARSGSQAQVREGMDRQYELNYYKERAKKRLSSKMKQMNPSSNSIINPKEESLDEGIEDMSDTDEPDQSPKVSAVDKSVHQPAKVSTSSLIDDTSSMSEVASCNYEARKAGVKNGMFLGPALKLCPTLQTIPYDFEGYKEVSYKLYDIVASFTHDIEAVSCDEMFVDLTELLQSCRVTPLQFTTYLRSLVQKETGCPCSAGLGPNMLVARLATRTAKPNGQHHADPHSLAVYMKDQKVNDLPGVGWSLGSRLEGEGIATCGDLQTRSLGQLQASFGSRTGHSLYNYCRGIDTRAVKTEHVRKSVSAEVNYGIRFTCVSDAHKFISELAEEVEGRLIAAGVKGRCITLKLKIRAKDAPVETAKFMGHGVCDNMAKSVSLAVASSSAAVIEREAISLLRQVRANPQDFRGVGIQVSRLEKTAGSSRLSNASSIKSFLLAAKSNASRKSDGNSTLGSDTLMADDPVSLGQFGSKARTDESHNKNSNFRVDMYKVDSKDVCKVGNDECRVDVKDMSKVDKEKSEVDSIKNNKIQPGSSTDGPQSSTNNQQDHNNVIDLEVLQALPEDMREQVIAEYQQQGYIIPGFVCGGGGGEGEPQPGMSSYVPSHRNCVEINRISRLNSAGEPQPGTSGYIPPTGKHVEVNPGQVLDENSGGYESSESSEVKTKRMNSFDSGSYGDDKDVTISELSHSVLESEQKPDSQSSRVPSLAEAVRGGSNSEEVFDDDSEMFITSFSQVDSSFLSAIPEELQEELRQDFERQKQEAAEAVAVAAAADLLSQQTRLAVQESSHRTEAAYEEWHIGRRGRWNNLDPRHAQMEGLTTLTSIVSVQPSTVERRGLGGRKRGRPPKNRVTWQPTRSSPTKKQSTRSSPTKKQSTRSSPTKKQPTRTSPTKKQPTRSSPTQKNNLTKTKEVHTVHKVPNGTEDDRSTSRQSDMQPVEEGVTQGSNPSENELVKSEVINEAAVEINTSVEEVPELCGVQEISEVKLMIREWVSSCSCPEVEDAEILANYYTSFVTCRDLEQLDLLIKYLYRQVIVTGNRHWENTYQTVVERVQAAMMDTHTMKLKVVSL